eukprot:1660373-Rhodomonas_salina.1
MRLEGGGGQVTTECQQDEERDEGDWAPPSRHQKDRDRDRDRQIERQRRQVKAAMDREERAKNQDVVDDDLGFGAHA